MSDLRNQLQAAKREYESLRYPGDLFADATSAMRGGSRMRIFVRSFSAIAAVIVMMLIGWIALRGSLHGTQSKPYVVESTTVTVAEASEEDEAVSVSMTTVNAPSWGEVFSSDTTDTATTAATVATTATSSAETGLAWPSVPSFPSIDEIDATDVSQTLDNQENE